MGTEEAGEPRRLHRLRRQVRRPGQARPHMHQVKVTAEQEAVLVSRAGELGWTVSRLLVESATAGEVTTGGITAGGVGAARARHELAGEMFRVVRLFGRVANNVNQIARVANSTGEVPAAAVHALASIDQVCDRFHRVLDGVEAR